MGRLLVTLFMLAVGLFGLLMSACGGIILVSSASSFQADFGLLLVGALMGFIGVGACWGALSWFRGSRRGGNPPGQDGDGTP